MRKKIIGVTVGTTMLRPDWNQTDPSKSDYIKNKPVGGLLTPEQTSLLEYLQDQYDKEHYTAMTGEFSATVGGTTVEIGATITSDFSWKFTKLPTTLQVGGRTISPPTQEGEIKDQTFTANSHTSRSFTIRGVYAGKYGDEPASATWTYYFRNKYYWGTKAAPTDEDGKLVTPDGDFIKSLSNSNWATSKTISFTPNCAEGDYVWYAYPKRLGEAEMWGGGFQGGFEEPLTVSVTNGYKHTEDYYVYRSTNSGVGDPFIQAK